MRHNRCMMSKIMMSLLCFMTLQRTCHAMDSPTNFVENADGDLEECPTPQQHPNLQEQPNQTDILGGRIPSDNNASSTHQVSPGNIDLESLIHAVGSELDPHPTESTETQISCDQGTASSGDPQPPEPQLGYCPGMSSSTLCQEPCKREGTLKMRLNQGTQCS